MSAAPLDIVAAGRRARPRRPDRDARGRRAGRRREHARPRRVGAAAPARTRRPARRRSQAVLDADWVVLGPGSWFTSVLPHLLVPDLRDALVDDPRPPGRVPQPAPSRPARPTASRPRTTCEVLLAHCPELAVDVVLGRRATAVVDAATRLRHAVEARRRPARPGPGRAGRRHAPARPGPAGRGLRRRADVTRREHARPDCHGGRRMAMTAAVKDELSRLSVTRPCCRKAEISALLRFAGGLHLVGGPEGTPAATDRRRGRARHRLDRAPAAQGDRRGLRPRQRRARRRRRRPAQGQPLRRARLQGRRGPGPADRAGRRPRPAGPRPAAAGRQRRHLRRRGRLARCVPRARLAHRARPLLLAGDHLPRSGGGAGAGRRGPPARRRRPRRARCAASTGSSSATATRSASCSPGSAPTRRCWPGRTAGCAARCGPPPTGWPTSTTPTCAARPARPSPPVPGSSARWRSSARTPRSTCSSPGRLRREHANASLEELGALADPPMTKDAVAGRIRRLLAMADKRAADLGIPDTESSVTAGDARPELRTGAS